MAWILIVSVRKGLGLSQGAFAEAVGVTRNVVVTCEPARLRALPG